MLAFQPPPIGEACELPDYQPSDSLRKVGGAVLHIVGRVLDAVAQVTLPAAPPDYTSEHFGHAQKRNNLWPDINLTQSR